MAEMMDLKMPHLVADGARRWTPAEERYHGRGDRFAAVYRRHGSPAAVRARRREWMLEMAYEFGFVPHPDQVKGVGAVASMLMPTVMWTATMPRRYTKYRDYEEAFELLGGRAGLRGVRARVPGSDRPSIRLLVRAVDDAGATAKVEAVGLEVVSVYNPEW